MFYTAFDSELPGSKFAAYLEKLPRPLRITNSKYARWRDRTANLFGKLLLSKGLAYLNLDYTLNDLKISKYRKPYINDKFDFSISHSGRYVICLIAFGQKAGIDVEQVANFDLNNFVNIFTHSEIASILSSTHPQSEFCRVWTVKESVMKADGRGLFLPLEQVLVSDGVAHIHDKPWFLCHPRLDHGYQLTIATEFPTKQLELHCISSSEF